MTPEQVRELPADEAAGMSAAFADAITMVFRYAVPLLVLGFMVTWLLKEIPLRSASAPAAQPPVKAGAGAEVPTGNGTDVGTPVAEAPADLVDWGEPSVATGG